MLNKSTGAFRTIGEAGDELDLQPHVLRFWESKFPQIQPMKRSGGRRFYRPEDIEFLRGIKILLHREKHPIKDVQKLIRIRGAQSVIDLGRSKNKPVKPKAIKDTNLVPNRIKPVAQPIAKVDAARPVQVSEPEMPSAAPSENTVAASDLVVKKTLESVSEQGSANTINRSELQEALRKLRSLKSDWEKLK